MQSTSSIKDLYKYLEFNSNKKITLIPTMGNLHKGHLKLIENAPANTLKIVSIYINKLQFNDSNDYDCYPRTIHSDLVKCQDHNVDMVFTPDESFVKNLNEYKDIYLPKFMNYLCGGTRDAHFIGVYQIVRNFFDIIKPKYACFGLKDYQQLLLVKFIASKYFPDLDIIEVETERNKEKIALSSRLNRLDEKSLARAESIFNSLKSIRQKIIDGDNFNIIKEKEIKKLESKGISVEYFEHRKNISLDLVKGDISNSSIFIACYINNIRLIDNIQI
jgi:pantoate--beta-alanine ligase